MHSVLSTKCEYFNKIQWSVVLYIHYYYYLHSKMLYQRIKSNTNKKNTATILQQGLNNLCVTRARTIQVSWFKSFQVFWDYFTYLNLCSKSRHTRLVVFYLLTFAAFTYLHSLKNEFTIYCSKDNRSDYEICCEPKVFLSCSNYHVVLNTIKD